jgi:N6-adenosine-specific RNA methylase IME4
MSSILYDSPVRVVTADPPWKFGDSLPGPKRGAGKHYETMTVAEIMAFQLPRLQDDAFLFLWRVAAMQQEALDVAKAWGFTVKSEIVWEKVTEAGKDWFGMGHYVRASHETCLIATRGRAKVEDRSVRSRFRAPVGRHSEKPDVFYEIVQRLSYGPYAELFARTSRKGWRQYGLEMEVAHP